MLQDQRYLDEDNCGQQQHGSDALGGAPPAPIGQNRAEKRLAHAALDKAGGMRRQ
jgi:hypothetical protein